MRAGDHGDVIFEWKWAQKHCTVNTDVFCIWWLWNLGETHIFASCFVMMLEKHWQAPKKNKAQSHKTLAGANKKKQNPSIYSGLWIPIDWKSLLFFGVPANVLWDCALFFVCFFGACASLMSLFYVEKSFKNHVPMVPKGNHRKQSESRASPSGRSDQV